MEKREIELLEKIYKRLGWIMFWIIVTGFSIATRVTDLSYSLP